MAKNDKMLLEQSIKTHKAQFPAGTRDSDHFEIFSAEQILKGFELSYDEIEDGLVGGKNDGGIDSLYLFVNGMLIMEEMDLENFKQDVVIEMFFIQSKKSTGFSESALEKFLASTSDLLDLSKNLGEMTNVYNENLINKLKLFRDTHLALSGRFPKLRFRYFYATVGDKPVVNVTRKAATLKAKIDELFSDVEAEVVFIGASELLGMTRSNPKVVHKLTTSNNPISLGNDDSIGFLTAVKLRDYFKFITNDKGELQRHLFDANVRDYQGSVQVNKDIKETLTNNSATVDFLWLNNGVTIVATNATYSGNTLTIENPLIVNGLQTSTEIFSYFSEYKPEQEERSVLVRIIQPGDEENRDKIIQATNNQTSIHPASLRATEKIHRDIEQYLGKHEIYYDRRKNFYKNQGKPRAKIIPIQKLAQVIASIVLRRPHQARRGASILFQNEDSYKEIFDVAYDVDIYRVCAVILQEVDLIIKSDKAKLEQSYRNNLRFHLAMYATLKACGNISPNIPSLLSIDLDKFNDAFLLACLDDVKGVFKADGETDQVAKSEKFTNNLIAKLGKKLRERKAPVKKR